MTKPDTREMYGEIATLMGALAKALTLSESDTIAAVERGEVTINFGKADNGNRFIAAGYQGKVVLLYQGAIKHAPDAEAGAAGKG